MTADRLRAIVRQTRPSLTITPNPSDVNFCWCVSVQACRGVDRCRQSGVPIDCRGTETRDPGMAEPFAQNGTAGDSPVQHRIRIPRDPLDDGIKRTSNWWTAAAFNITAIVGLGVLGLPHAMVFLSWGGLVVMALASIITFFTLKQLVELHEVDSGKRYMTYQDLGNRAFGAPLGNWIVLPMQMVVEFSLDVLFTVAVGEAMIRIVGNCHHQWPIYVWFVAFGAIQVALSCVFPYYSSIKWLAVMAAVMSVCYSTIAWITLMTAKSHDRSYGPLKQLLDNNLGVHTSYLHLDDGDRALQALNAVGVIAFAYAAHNVVLDIQTDLPSPSEKEMMKGVKFTYLVVSLCYFPMAIAVYAKYGNRVSSNVLGFMVGRVPHGWVIATNIMLIVHLTGSYQIFAIPLFKLLEVHTHYSPYIIRIVYIFSTTLLAIIFPFFSLLLGFFGGFVIAPTTFTLPCIMWLYIKGNSRWTKAHYINWAFIIIGIVIMFVSIVGGIGNLIKQIRIYDFYRIFSRKHWDHSGFYSNCTRISSHR